MKKLPIARTELRDIVEEDFCYVDKTPFVKQLLDDKHRYYFLSRPRRFGKSLFLNTLREAFSGQKELFKGLYLEHNWDWNVKYPVISISFGGGTATNCDELNHSFMYSLNRIAIKYQIDLQENFLPKRFQELIVKLHDQFKLPVVILIDEYDKPILDNITKPIVNEIRETLSSFYSVLKDASEYLKFVFLTGVSRFSKTSIFSKLNNITDISLLPKYADICGYTQHDLETIFADYLHDVDLQKVKRWYDGYNFLGSQLYNPYDVLLFLWEKRYKCFWFETGTPTFLLELIKKHKYFVPQLDGIEISESQIAQFDIENIKIETLLFQTGYLTIESVETVGDEYFYKLKLPNIEVKKGLTEYLANSFYLQDINQNVKVSSTKSLYQSIMEQNPDLLKASFVSLFSAFPNNWYTNNNISHYEGFYCTIFYVCFTSIGLDVRSEDTTNLGRIDFTVLTHNSVYIFEIKMKTNPQNALKQIKEKKYFEKYLVQKKDIFLVGIEFDEEARNISDFEWEKITAQI